MIKKFVLITIFSVLLILPTTVRADDPPSPVGTDECGDQALYTAIGCIPISGGDAFIIFVLRWAIGIAGGIALLLIAYSGVLIMTAGGDPQRVQAGQELLTAAIAGFLFLLFSTLILEFVGVRILGIPGL